MANHTEHWSDEDLSAFLDGMLDHERSTALEARLDSDSDLAARLASLVAANDAVKGAFDAPLSEPVPDRFRTIIEAASQPIVQPSVVTPFPHRAKSRPAMDWRLPLAAGFALVVGAIGGGIGAGLMTPTNSSVMARLGPALHAAPSAQSVNLGDGETLKPILTFAAADGRYCREFELTQRGDGFVGVACLQDNVWQLEAMLATQTKSEIEGGYNQASGHAGAALDSVLTALGAGEPLSAEAEKDALRKGFVKPANSKAK